MTQMKTLMMIMMILMVFEENSLIFDSSYCGTACAFLKINFLSIECNGHLIALKFNN